MHEAKVVLDVDVLVVVIVATGHPDDEIPTSQVHEVDALYVVLGVTAQY
jgi:hypothetical protein